MDIIILGTCMSKHVPDIVPLDIKEWKILTLLILVSYQFSNASLHIINVLRNQFAFL